MKQNVPEKNCNPYSSQSFLRRAENMAARFAKSFRARAEETHRLTQTAVYSGIAESEMPLSEYSALAQLTAKRQAVLAGYRLFVLLSTLSRK